MDPILVTGGTGTLGRHVIRRLNSAGHHIRVFTRQPRNDEKGVSFARGDLLSGIGLDAAVGVSRRSFIVLEAVRATTLRRGISSTRRHASDDRTSSTSRSLAPIGCRWSDRSIARCLATSR